MWGRRPREPRTTTGHHRSSRGRDQRATTVYPLRSGWDGLTISVSTLVLGPVCRFCLGTREGPYVTCTRPGPVRRREGWAVPSGSGLDGDSGVEVFRVRDGGAERTLGGEGCFRGQNPYRGVSARQSPDRDGLQSTLDVWDAQITNVHPTHTAPREDVGVVPVRGGSERVLFGGRSVVARRDVRDWCPGQTAPVPVGPDRGTGSVAPGSQGSSWTLGLAVGRPAPTGRSPSPRTLRRRWNFLCREVAGQEALDHVRPVRTQRYCPSTILEPYPLGRGERSESTDSGRSSGLWSEPEGVRRRAVGPGKKGSQSVRDGTTPCPGRCPGSTTPPSWAGYLRSLRTARPSGRP